jgi:hypothetical protein
MSTMMMQVPSEGLEPTTSKLGIWRRFLCGFEGVGAPGGT